MSYGSYGKGPKGKGKAWAQPSWEKGGDKGKAKGKGKGKGDKGKGKGKDRQCYNCSGWGHIAAQCPTESSGGKGVNEVADAAEHDDRSLDHDDGEDDEEPPWLGMLCDATQASSSFPSIASWTVRDFGQPCKQQTVRDFGQPCKQQTVRDFGQPCKQQTVRDVGQPCKQQTYCQTARKKTSKRKKVSQADQRWTCYNQFGLLEDLEDEPTEAGCEEIMVVTDKKDFKWTKISAVVDSGAVEHVLPEKWIPCVEMVDSPGSKAGKKYLSATGQEIPNLGQKSIVCKTKEGQSRGLVFQVAPVRKPLMSVAKMNEAGNDVNLRGDNPHIEHKKSGQITKLRREGKTFILDLWIKHPIEQAILAQASLAQKYDKVQNGDKGAGFSRQG
jgi:hypothetical protein